MDKSASLTKGFRGLGVGGCSGRGWVGGSGVYAGVGFGVFMGVVSKRV